MVFRSFSINKPCIPRRSASIGLVFCSSPPGVASPPGLFKLSLRGVNFFLLPRFLTSETLAPGGPNSDGSISRVFWTANTVVGIIGSWPGGRAVCCNSDGPIVGSDESPFACSMACSSAFDFRPRFFGSTPDFVSFIIFESPE